jgi:hypothetical protein
MTRKKIILITLLSALLLVFIFPILRHFSEVNLSPEETKIKKDKAKNEYLALFQSDFQKGLIPDYSNIGIMKSKYPFLLFNYGSKDFWNNGTTHEIIIHKVILKSNQSLEKLVQFGKGPSKRTDKVYAGHGLGEGEFIFTSEGDSLVDNIYLTYDCELINKSISGDSLLNFRMQTSNFAIAYEKGAPGDIVFDTPYNHLKKTSPKSTFTISFYKKKLAVYLIFIRQTSSDKLEKDPLINRLIGLCVL